MPCAKCQEPRRVTLQAEDPQIPLVNQGGTRAAISAHPVLADYHFSGQQCQQEAAW